MSFLKVMMSSSPTTPDLPPHSSVLSLTFSELENDQTRNFGSMNIDDLLKNIYGDTEPFPADYGSAGDESVPWQGSFSLPKNVGSKTVDEVWKEISGGRREQEMTLEDFLTKAGAVREEEVRLPVIQPEAPGLGADSMMNIASQFEAPALLRSPRSGTGGFCVESAGFGNRIDGRGGGNGCNGGGRGKRRLVEEPVDKATQQKQRRMIKNRESAARSRERKQAYTVELESLVTQLGEENAKLLREEAKQTKERFKQLTQNASITVCIPGIETQLKTLVKPEGLMDENLIDVTQTLETDEVGANDDDLVSLPNASRSAQAGSKTLLASGDEEVEENDDVGDFEESYNPGYSPSPDNIFVAMGLHGKSGVLRRAPTIASQEMNPIGPVDPLLGQSTDEGGGSHVVESQKSMSPSQSVVSQAFITNEQVTWEDIGLATATQPVESVLGSESKLNDLLKETDLRPELVEVLSLYDQSHPEMLAGYVQIDSPLIKGYSMTALGEVLLKFQGFKLERLVAQVIDEFRTMVRDLKHTGVDLSWISRQFDKIERTLAAPEVMTFLDEDRAVTDLAKLVHLAQEELHKVQANLAQAQERKMKALEVVRSVHGDEAIQLLKAFFRGSI